MKELQIRPETTQASVKTHNYMHSEHREMANMLGYIECVIYTGWCVTRLKKERLDTCFV